MKPRLLFSQLIFLFCLCNCSNQKQTVSISMLKHQRIDLEDNIIGYGGFLVYCQDVIIGIEMNPSMQAFFCLESNKSSQSFFFFGNRGRGPHEFLMPYCIQYINNQTVGVLDVMSNTFFEFAIPSENEISKIRKEVKFQHGLTRIIKTAFGQYIGLSVDKEMFLLADSTGTLINTFFEYPFQNKAEHQYVTRSMAYQGTLAANPSKNKFAYSSFRGEIIHFYAIENNNIEVIAKIENKYPLYKVVNDGLGGILPDQQGQYGYIATYATEKFVYTIFSGETVREFIERKSINFEGNILRVFDWNGVLVKEYELDVPCSYLCVSDDDSKIWTILSIQDEITLVLFDLESVTEDSKDDETTKERDWRASKSTTGTLISIEVRTKDGQQNDETRKVLDSIRSVPSNVALNLRPTNRYDVQTDITEDNIRKIVITLK